jgi:hypothetical protein
LFPDISNNVLIKYENLSSIGERVEVDAGYVVMSPNMLVYQMIFKQMNKKYGQRNKSAKDMSTLINDLKQFQSLQPTFCHASSCPLLLLFTYHFITLKGLFGMSSSYGSW